jgi:NhaP-type Na+/H+ or K+/H+ antiporter
MVVIDLGRDGYQQIVAVITLTVLMSILLHGITAIPFSKLFQEKQS